MNIYNYGTEYYYKDHKYSLHRFCIVKNVMTTYHANMNNCAIWPVTAAMGKIIQCKKN